MINYESLEKERHELYEAHKRERTIGSILIVVAILFLVIAFASEITPLIIITFITGGIGAFYMIKSSQKHSLFKSKIQPKIIHYLLNDMFDDATHSRNEMINISRINEIGLIKQPDRHSGEDYVKGTYKGVKFEVSDITLQERVVRTDSKGNTYVTYENYFKGRWYIYKMDKKQNGVLKITEGRPYDTRGLQKIETESIAFNKKFSTYATDQHLLFYLLTPVMLEKMLMLEQTNKGNTRVCFIGNELHVAINDNKDYMELDFKKPITKDGLSYIINDFELIAAIINEFRLDSLKFMERKS